MLSDWLAVFACPRAISFSCVLSDLQKGCWLLAIQFGLLRAADIFNFWLEYSRQPGHFSFGATFHRFVVYIYCLFVGLDYGWNIQDKLVILVCIDLWYTSDACWFGLCFELGFIAEFKNRMSDYSHK